MECMLCFEIYNNLLNKPYSLYKCGHTYCISCINKLSDKKCPMCNQIFIDKIPCYAAIQMIKEPDLKKEDEVKTADNSSDDFHDGMYLTFESYEKNILVILNATADFQNEVIFREIESEFGGIDSQNKVFIRALVTAVCRCCLDEKNRIEKLKLKSLCALLSIFIARNQEFEFEAFFAIKSLQQELSNQLGLIQSVLEIFFAENIFSTTVQSVIKNTILSENFNQATVKIENFKQPAQPTQIKATENILDNTVREYKKRKCGICREEGHNRTFCPQRRQQILLNNALQ